ncbi:MAG: zf-HC2 domain-containing protein [Pyrinomonadaceae bacterium]
MNCDDLQRELSLYVDDQLASESRTVCNAHLARCPACREQLVETRKLIRNLNQLSRLEAPSHLSSAIRSALSIESAALSSQRPIKQTHEVVFGWLRPLADAVYGWRFHKRYSLCVPFRGPLAIHENPAAAGDWYGE